MPFTVYTHSPGTGRPTVRVINKAAVGYEDPNPSTNYLYVFTSETDPTPAYLNLTDACELSGALIYAFEDSDVRPQRVEVTTVFECSAGT